MEWFIFSLSVEIIKTERTGSGRFVDTAQEIRNQLFHCAIDEELEDLTQLYRNHPSDSSPFGYDPLSVSKFIRQLQQRYPKDTKC